MTNSSTDGSLNRVNLDPLVVRPIQPAEEERWDSLMGRHHYLGFSRLVGESLKYVAILQGRWVALLGWAAAVLKCGPRDEWLGWNREQQWDRLKFVTNNQRFLILPDIRIQNLASKTLALNVNRLAADWQAIFGHPVVLAETFVDPNRFQGTCYKAAGWQVLGHSQGFGYQGGEYYHHGRPKMMLVRPLKPHVPEILSAPFLHPLLQGAEPLMNLNELDIFQAGGLLDRLQQLQDPRQARGIRHSMASILAVAICAVLSGARNFIAIGEWSAGLAQTELQLLGCRYNETKECYEAPSEPTIRRMLQTIDPDLLDHLVYDWLAEQTDMESIAVDGKALRGATGPDGHMPHLMAALVHKEGVVTAPKQVNEKSNEITAFRPLLKPLDLTGTVVTADAMHAQDAHARYLVEEKQADYLFTVKDNQHQLLEDIKTLDTDDFSPSVHPDQ